MNTRPVNQVDRIITLSQGHSGRYYLGMDKTTLAALTSRVLLGPDAIYTQETAAALAAVAKVLKRGPQ